MRDVKDRDTISDVIRVLTNYLVNYSRIWPYDTRESSRIRGYIEALFQTKFITEHELRRLIDIMDDIGKETRDTMHPVPEQKIYPRLLFLHTDPELYEAAPVDEFGHVIEYGGEKYE